MTERVVVSIVALLGGLVFAYLIERMNADERRFVNRARRATGEVADKWIDGEGGTTISVRFSLDNQPFYFSAAGDASIGETVQVDYDPDEPDNAILSGKSRIGVGRMIVWGWLLLWGLTLMLASD